MELTRYFDVRSQMQPGDLIAFSGKGHFSNIIKWRTDSNVSHVGTVLHRYGSFDPSSKRVELVESTSLDGKTGVVACSMSHRLETYNGSIWWLPLHHVVRTAFKEAEFIEFMTRQLGKPYDFLQAIGSAVDTFDVLFENDPDYSRFFCSELVAAGWLEAGVLNAGTNPSEQTPIDLVKLQGFFSEARLLRLAPGEQAEPPTGFWPARPVREGGGA
jgi:hypothetical protein